MRQYRVKMTDLAEKDLENAGDYIAFILLNPTAAVSTVKGIRDQMNKLAYFPESHELEDDPILANLGVHKAYYKDYKIFHTIDSEKKVVYVVRILHMLVDSRAWLYDAFGVFG